VNLRKQFNVHTITQMGATQLRSAIKTVLPWAVVSFCVALGLLSDIFRMRQAVIAGFAAVIVVFAYTLASRSTRLSFSRKFPFIQFVTRSTGD
jgi:branched-subunit amino acid transport protein AzlD